MKTSALNFITTDLYYQNGLMYIIEIMYMWFQLKLDWVHLGTPGTRGGDPSPSFDLAGSSCGAATLAAWHLRLPRHLRRSGLAAGEIAARDRHLQSKNSHYTVCFNFTGV
jgi:hypothetical protein